MSKVTTLLAGAAILAIAVVFVGCAGDSEPEKPDPADEQSQGSGDDGHAHDEDGGHGDDADEADAGKEKYLANLSAEDRAAIEKQKICPVSGGSLWSMAVPPKVTVTDSKGQEHVVFLCCSGCEEDLKSDPDTYLAKINK